MADGGRQTVDGGHTNEAAVRYDKPALPGCPVAHSLSPRRDTFRAGLPDADEHDAYWFGTDVESLHGDLFYSCGRPGKITLWGYWN